MLKVYAPHELKEQSLPSIRKEYSIQNIQVFKSELPISLFQMNQSFVGIQYQAKNESGVCILDHKAKLLATLPYEKRVFTFNRTDFSLGKERVALIQGFVVTVWTFQRSTFTKLFKVENILQHKKLAFKGVSFESVVDNPMEEEPLLYLLGDWRNYYLYFMDFSGMKGYQSVDMEILRKP